MSIIRITTLTILFILLATLPSQPTSATVPNEPAQFSCTNVTEIPQIECEALVALYNGTDGPNWQNTTGWLVTNMPCEWYGVTCDGGHVTQLNLRGSSSSNPFGLQGHLPAEISNLNNLTELQLNHNELSSLPSSIGNLSRLTEFYLNANQLSSLPVEVGNLNNLTTLDIYGNQLSSLPDEISNLNNLLWLGLSHNRLSKLPSSISNLNKLAGLYIIDNQLNSLPSSFGNLTNLTELWLYSNQLGSLPPSISNLNNLTDLRLDYNRLDISDDTLRAFLDLHDPDWAETQTIVPTEIRAIATGHDSIKLSWATIAFQDKFGYYEISVADGDIFTIQGTTASKLDSHYIIDGLSSRTTYNIRIRTYTSDHSGDPNDLGDDQHNELWSNYSEIVSATTLDQPTPMPTNVPTNTPTATATPMPPDTSTPTPTDTPTSTDTATPTSTATLTNTPTDAAMPMPTHTSTSMPTPNSDRSDDDCNQATQINSSDILPENQFESPLDVDWYTFQATAGTAYRITVDIPSGSKADVNLELYPSCGPGPIENWTESFAPGVQLDFTPSNSGPLYLRLVNADDSVGGPEWRYQLSIRQLNQESETGAVIIVAGRLKLNDRLQDNIYSVTDRVFSIFQDQGYTTDDIYYLAPEADEVHHHDATATVDNVGWAITNWAVERLQDEDVPDVLTLFMMDHGGIDKLYLDGSRDEILSPTELDGWLDTLEESVPGVLINVIIEACHSGSFIQLPGSISGPDRVIITSSNQESDAYASRSGATFSDQFLTSLQQGDNLLSSWSQAKDVAADLFVLFPQRPWINGDGDDIHNELEDFVAASERGFAYAGTLDDESSRLWPPYVVQVLEPDELDGNSIAISAEVRDDRGVGHVWATIYPPSYAPPARDSEDELLDGEDENLERIVLDHKGDDIYRGRAYNFTEAGTYRIVVHADDADGLMARPVVLEYNTSEVFATVGRGRIYLPYISR